MQKRTLKVALLAVLSIVLVLGMSTVALADQTWPDLPDTITAKYGVDDNQIATISEGFTNGLWKPYQTITRAQFTKMAVAAFTTPLMDPAVASFTDVPKGSLYYPYIEGAKAAGLIDSATATTFAPNTAITRQDAFAILARGVAKANGLDLATMYTTAEIDGLLAHFGDQASISADLRDEIAFAYDFGLTKGNDYANFVPAATITRIQGATALIRAMAKIPPAQWTAAKIELVGADKTENLIGVNREVTFKVTTADGHPAVGVTVDFDELTGGGLYTNGNINQEAAVTDSFGLVTVNLISTEPGTQRMSAAVSGVGAIYVTAYWVALDEIYITDLDREAENNAGESHTWGARVVVMGPGPRSTSVQDWYNSIGTAAFNPANIDEDDGVDASCDIFWYFYDYWEWDYASEQTLAMFDLKPRTLAGINVNWAIVPYVSVDLDDLDFVYSEWIDPQFDAIAGGDYVYLYAPDGVWDSVTSVKFGAKSAAFLQTSSGVLYVRVPAVTLAKTVDIVVTDAEGSWNLGEFQYINYVTLHDSVGDITAVDGVAITPAKTAVGVTNADGYSSITILSQVTGQTNVQAIADYAGNPYPQQMFEHETFQTEWGWHDYDWIDQGEPGNSASALKTWIPHVIGGDANVPITAASFVNNVGEVETFTLTLKDTYGNVIPDYTVEWWIQGVGEFKSDGSSWSGIAEENKDIDTTDALGQAVAMVTSNEPGQTVLHCKVVDKYGLPYKEWNVVKQWYAIDSAGFLDTKDADGEIIPAVNLVGTTHTFTFAVSGMKWVYVLYDVNENGLRDDQVLIGDRNTLKALEGDLIGMDGSVVGTKYAGDDLNPGAVMGVDLLGGYAYFTRYADYDLLAGEFWAPGGFIDLEGDDYKELTDLSAIPVVWSVLPGKNVWFYSNIGDGEAPDSDSSHSTDESESYPWFVGTITAPTTQPVVTDANGLATVTITSEDKGFQWVYAVVDYPENPLDGDAETPTEWFELLYDVALKTWVLDSSGTNSMITFAADAEDSDAFTEGVRFTNPVETSFLGYDWVDLVADDLGDVQDDEEDATNLNTEILAVAMFDKYGNAIAGYRVEFEIMDQGETDEGTIDTYHPYAHFSDVAHTEDEVVEEPGMDDWDATAVAGIYDRGKWVDTNLIWDGADDEDDYGFYDDDKAIGFTLDGAINFNYDLDCAAWAELTLDETYGMLDDMDEEHFTTVVNVKVYSPAGAFVDDFYFTKVWSLEEPAIDEMVLAISKYDGYGYSTSLTTAEDTVYFRVQLFDQWGNPWTETLTAADLLKINFGGEEGIGDLSYFDSDTPDEDGYLYGSYTYDDEGTYSLRAWLDDKSTDPDNGSLDTSEVRSNKATYVNE